MPSLPNIDAVIVRLTIHRFSNRVKDATITDETIAAKALGLDSGAWWKNKLPPDAVAAINKQAGVIRGYHYSRTLPWEEGYRLLNSAAHAGYERDLAPHVAEFNSRVEELGQHYASHVEAARTMHGSTFDESDYPDWRTVRARFGVEVSFLPVPQSSHFISGFTQPIITRMRTELESANNRRFEEAVRDTWTRLLAPVQAMADKLASGDAIFRDSLVENVKEITTLVPTLNLTNDRAMREAADIIHAQLATLDPQALRENKVQRREVAAAAAAIVNRFGSLGSRKFSE